MHGSEFPHRPSRKASPNRRKPDQLELETPDLSLLEQVDVTDQVTHQRVVIATELVDDITRLEDQMKASKKRIRAAVDASGTTLCDIRGIGPIGAAIILSSVGDITRFPTAGHFASTTPPPPSKRPRVTRDGIGSTR